MPLGTSGLSVEQRNFEAEAQDAEGFKYFRAPDFLAPKILELPGFNALKPPDGATGLDDLPQVESEADEAMQALGRRLASAEMERDQLRDDNKRLTEQNTKLAENLRRTEGKVAELSNEVNVLKANAKLEKK